MARLLLVDDDNYIRDAYYEVLKDEGFNVDTATDGKEALQKVGQAQYDLVLLDIMMPNLDGIGALKELRANEKTKNLPVVILTNFGYEKVVKEAFDYGVSDFVLKYNITPGEVADKVKEVLKHPEETIISDGNEKTSGK